MAKTELPLNLKQESTSPLPPLEDLGLAKPKINAFLAKVFDITKFLFGALLLPLVYSSSLCFWAQLGVVDKGLQGYFWSGAIAFIIFYLFILEPTKVYTKGQKILELVFSFFKPLVRVAPYVLPIYALLLFALYWLVSLFTKALLGYFMLLFGLSLALHLVFSARSLRSKQGGFLKGNYIFGFSFVYILNLAIAVFCLNILFEQVSFVGFCNNSFQLAKGIYSAVFKQLFVV